MSRVRYLSLQTRRLSTLLKKDIHSLQPKDLTHESINHDDYDGLRKLIVELSNSSNPAKLKLYEHLIPTFGRYFQIQDSSFDNEMLKHLIDLNPGRVFTTAELFEKHANEKSNDLVNHVFNKLVKEYIEDTESEIDSVFAFFEQYGREMRLGQGDTSAMLLTEMIKREDAKLIRRFFGTIDVNKEVCLEVAKHKLDSSWGRFAFIELVKQWFRIGAADIRPWVYEVTLRILNFNNNDLQNLVGANESESDEFATLSNDIINFINESKMDMEASNVYLRSLILEVCGIARDDLDATLRKYAHYEGFAPFGLESLKQSMVKIFAYQAIKHNKSIYVSTAEAIQPPETTISSLQLLIVLKSYFNADDGLELFNSYVSQVSDTVKEGKSQKGALTEAIILGFLVHNDREFATLIFDKAVEGQIILDELEITRIKKWFKAYSDSFIEKEDWEAHAKHMMKEQALQFIQNVGTAKLLALIPKESM